MIETKKKVIIMLTNLLLVIAVTGGFLYGLMLMRGLDRFMEHSVREVRQRDIYTASAVKERSKSCTGGPGQRCFTEGKNFSGAWS